MSHEIEEFTGTNLNKSTDRRQKIVNKNGFTQPMTIYQYIPIVYTVLSCSMFFANSFRTFLTEKKKA